jgi:hypothetical protein
LIADWFRQRSWAVTLGGAVGITVARLVSGLVGFGTAMGLSTVLGRIGLDLWSAAAAAAVASAAWTFLTSYLVVRSVRTAPLPLLLWFAIVVAMSSISPRQIGGNPEYLLGFLLMEKSFSIAAVFGGGVLALIRRQQATSAC